MIRNEALDNAFAELRSIGYFAERNWECCNTCGLYALPEDKRERYIFLHSQAEDTLEDMENAYANWGGNARIIVGILEKHGIRTDGVPEEDFKIRIYAEDERVGKDRYGDDYEEDEE